MDMWQLLRHLDDRHGYVPQGTIRHLDGEYIKLMSKHTILHNTANKLDGEPVGHGHARLGRAVSWVVEEVTDPTERRGDLTELL